MEEKMKKFSILILISVLVFSLTFTGCDLINKMFGGKPGVPKVVTESGYLNGPGSSYMFQVKAGKVDYVEVTFTYPRGSVDFWVTVVGENGETLGNFDLDNGEIITLSGGGNFWLTIYSIYGAGDWSATYTLAAAPATPMTPPTPQGPEVKASVNGKYYNLLQTLYVPQDQGSYGDFYEWGYWSGSSYAGYTNLTPGYWVYVYPNWYIWGNTN